MNNALLKRFIDDHDYDIRKTGNGRWIDQKCAADEVSFVADCVVDFIDKNGNKPFQSPDVWRSEYAIENVQSIFSKPDPLKKTTIDEYNKFFRQPLKMLAAAGVLMENGRLHNTIQFSVVNYDVLEYISMRDRNAYEFLCLYIEKTLRDSGLWDAFETFFDEETEDSYEYAKEKFSEFCIKYTPINTAREADRIFIKVLNPLACKYHKKGTKKGRLSNYMITFNDILYNKPNWRDVNKDKNVARGDVKQAEDISSEAHYQYNVQRAMKNIKKYNDKYRGGRSEVNDEFSLHGAKATHMHHIFPKSVDRYAVIADYLENIIALTPAQHLQKAHPNGNTQKIDRTYQYLCLIAKTETIRRNLSGVNNEPQIYSFSDFMYVLDIGLDTDYFEKLSEDNYDAVLTGIDFNYQ